MAVLERRDGSVIAEDPNKTIKQLAKENGANLDGANLICNIFAGFHVVGEIKVAE